jgi:hypothetical protein
VKTDRVTAAEFRSATPERDILASCLELLAVRGIVAWRANTGAVTKENAAGRKRFVRFGTRGQSDILGLIPPSGRLIAVECKSSRGRLTDDQRKFLRSISNAGGVALVIRDVSELEKALQEIA